MTTYGSGSKKYYKWIVLTETNKFLHSILKTLKSSRMSLWW